MPLIENGHYTINMHSSLHLAASTQHTDMLAISRKPSMHALQANHD
jgi:hypothetical protein